MPDLIHTYELTLEIINHSPHQFHFRSQMIAPHQDDDLTIEEKSCKEASCTYHLKSPTSFMLELSNPKLNQEFCYIDQLKIKRLRFQSFLRKNPYRGTYRIEISNTPGCNIKSQLIDAEQKSWFSLK
ncbi:hypothetical protein OAT84_03160 [Gammaproteobacteria bacterium]|nr:hypothetical protein [Gammaproteobacteria bacterium]